MRLAGNEGHDVFWCSPPPFVRDALAAGKPVRGGSQYCSQFGKNVGGVQHGYMRQSDGRILGYNPARQLRMGYTADGTRPGEAFKAEFTAISRLDASGFTQLLHVTSLQEAPFDLTLALHPYFLVSHIDHVVIEGMAGAELVSGKTGSLSGDVLGPREVFRGEVDALYRMKTPQVCFRDEAWRRTIYIDLISTDLLQLWQPGSDQGKPEFMNGQWTGFGCGEPVVEFTFHGPGHTLIFGMRVRVEQW
jgi:glucose-6-phosphate 1-epimerase